jgi:hypothetical protein
VICVSALTLFLTSHNPVSRYPTVLHSQAEPTRINLGLRRWLSSPGEVPRRVPFAEYYIFVKLHVESVAVMNQSARSASNIIQSYRDCNLNLSTLNFQNVVSIAVLTSSGLLAACGGGGGGEPAPNTDPVVEITPSADAQFNVGETVSLQATATDAEDGNLTSSILWTSNSQDFDPALQGGIFSVSTLKVATHRITAEVTDSDGNRQFVGVNIRIINDKPEISANVADNRTEVIVGESVTLQATVSDTEDDDVSLAVEWSSDLVENLGAGGSLEVIFELSDIGQRTITATVTDSNDASAPAPGFEIDVLPAPESLYIKASNTEGPDASCRVNAIINDNGTPDDVTDDVVGNGCDNFGFAVALSEDGRTLAVGAPFEDGIDNSLEDSGVVHVYRGNGAGDWVLDVVRDVLRAPDADLDDRFGSGLALNADGSVLAVTGNGRAYIYLDEGASWSAGTLVGTFNNTVRASVALNSAGNVLAVGAAGEGEVGSPKVGSVSLYTLAAGVASPPLELMASNPGAEDRFGVAVALDSAGDTLIVGASQESSASASEADNAAESAGAAYIFERTGDDWNQREYLKATNIQANSGFGTAVAINFDGTRVAVGAPLENSAVGGVSGDEPTSPCRPDCKGDEGAAYVFSTSGGGWDLVSRTVASNMGAGDQFGSAVALTSDGRTLFVGARAEDSEGKNINGTQTDDFYSNAEDEGLFYNEANSGAVYEFLDGSQQNYYKAFNSAEGDKFGRIAISADGLVLAVGANLEDGSGQGIAPVLDNIEGLQTGAVYLFQ